MRWFQPGSDVAMGGRMPALVHGMLPEWMSPTCRTRLTLRSALTESISRCALSNRFWLYGQSPNTAMVRGWSRSSLRRSWDIATDAAIAQPATSTVETSSFFMGFDPRMLLSRHARARWPQPARTTPFATRRQMSPGQPMGDSFQDCDDPGFSRFQPARCWAAPTRSRCRCRYLAPWLRAARF